MGKYYLGKNGGIIMSTEACQNESSRQKARRENADKWRTEMEEYKISGLNQSEYCRQKGINYSMFLYWKRKLLKPRPTSTGLKIVEVRGSLQSMIGGRSKGISSFRILIEDVCIEIEEGFSSRMLSEILQTIRRS